MELLLHQVFILIGLLLCNLGFNLLHLNVLLQFLTFVALLLLHNRQLTMVYLLKVKFGKHLCALLHLKMARDNGVLELDEIVFLEVREEFADLACTYEQPGVINIEAIR